MTAVSEQVSLEDIYEHFALVSDSSQKRIIRSDNFLAVMLLVFLMIVKENLQMV